jgi:anti-sigma B factor antagonist
MEIRQTTIGNVSVVRLSGRFDSAAVPLFKKEVQVPDGDHAAKFVIEMAEVGYVDSGGLGSLVALLRQAKKNDGDVKISVIPAKIQYVFELTKINRIFDIYDNTEVAISSFASN